MQYWQKFLKVIDKESLFTNEVHWWTKLIMVKELWTDGQIHWWKMPENTITRFVKEENKWKKHVLFKKENWYINGYCPCGPVTN